MSLQDNTNQSLTDFLHYQWIFEEAEQGKTAGKNAADKSSGTPATQYPSRPLKRP
jgi:ribosome maturation protein Sdo1